MAFGLLESKSNPHPPGTVLLADESTLSDNTEAVISRNLKHGTGANKHIVLVPQPSNDPNDPLNWSIWYRDSVVLALVFCTFTFAGAIGPLISPIAFSLVVEYNVSFTKVSLLTGWQLLSVAIIGFFVSPATRKIGKRPVITVCSLLGLGGSIWLIFAESYNSLLGARVLQAFGVAFYESVGFSMVADMYCVHERGSRIAAYLFPLGAFNILCPLLAGVVAQNMGITWMYRWMAIFAGLATCVAIFYIPETAFNRSEIYNIDTNSVSNLGDLAEKQVRETNLPNSEHIESQPTHSMDPTIQKRNYLSRLRPWSITESFSNESFISLVLGPLKLFLNPAVLWSCLTQGAVSAWTVAVSFILAQIFAVPPYNFNPAQVGYLNTGALVGGLLAEIVCVLSNDRFAKAFAVKNGGVYEPEFRLWLIIPMVITGVIGFFGFGNGISAGLGPIVASMFYGFITASLIFSHVASSSYMTDAFRNHSVEIFIAVMVFKNLLFFVFSLVVNDWIQKDGPKKVFNIIGSLQLAIGFLSVPLYILGKKNRALMHKWWFMN